MSGIERQAPNATNKQTCSLIRSDILTLDLADCGHEIYVAALCSPNVG